MPSRARIARACPGSAGPALRLDHHVADLAVGLQILRGDVEPAPREHLVEPAQHARHVAVDVDVARAGRPRRQLHLRESSPPPPSSPRPSSPPACAPPPHRCAPAPPRSSRPHAGSGSRCRAPAAASGTAPRSRPARPGTRPRPPRADARRATRAASASRSTTVPRLLLMR